MRALKILVHAAVIWYFSSQVSVALAQEDDSIYGTHSVVFQPVQVGGELIGCTLVYKAVQPDSAYLRGNLIVIVGNIAINQFGADIGLSLKVGVKELVGDHQFVRPNFAYLQTKSHSTAKAKQQTMDGNDGFSLFVYSLYDSSVIALLGEMMDLGKVTVAFNREKNGIDVLVPVDFDVIDAEYPGGGKVVRKRSSDTMANFASCTSTLMKQAKRSLDKK